jgi:ubiquinol-cytochrome c reductase cytochrome b subunit
LGLLLGRFLGMQILTGIWLRMYYLPDANNAFNSIDRIMRDVNLGWFFRYSHRNGASFLFFFLYLHIARRVYYRSYLTPRNRLWLSGISLLLLMIITSFLGYVLPWGQMSFWARTVITNLVTVIPFFGNEIAEWLWGGYTVSTITLNRFFALHYILPFIIRVISLLHLKLLHDAGSTNPLQSTTEGTDYITFYPYFFLKDMALFFLRSSRFFSIVCFRPNILGHSDNYIPANSLVTPTHIVPEWYFLFFYAILRAVPNKLFGVLFLMGSIIMLIHLIYLQTNIQKNYIQSPVINRRHKCLFWIFISHFIIISWLGAQPIEYPYDSITRLYISSYFIITGFGYLCRNKFERNIITREGHF